MRTIKCIQSVVQFSRGVHHTPLFCYSRGKRITFFNLVQIRSDLLFHNVFLKRIKVRTCPFTAGRHISQGNRNLPLKATLAAPNSGASASIAAARSQAKTPHALSGQLCPGDATPSRTSWSTPRAAHPGEHTQGGIQGSTSAGPGSREQFGTRAPPGWLSCSVRGTGSLRPEWQPAYARCGRERSRNPGP